MFGARQSSNEICFKIAMKKVGVIYIVSKARASDIYPTIVNESTWMLAVCLRISVHMPSILVEYKLASLDMIKIRDQI